MARKNMMTYETEKKIFPTRLREIMQENHTTQKMLGDAIGVRPQTISLYCTGQSSPDADGLTKICDYYKVSADWILGRIDVKSVDSNLAAACSYTGLSEGAVDYIYREKRFARAVVVKISKFLESPYANAAFSKISVAEVAITRMIRQVETQDFRKNPIERGFIEEVIGKQQGWTKTTVIEKPKDYMEFKIACYEAKKAFEEFVDDYFEKKEHNLQNVLTERYTEWLFREQQLRRTEDCNVKCHETDK